jgi:hypothetical protein
LETAVTIVIFAKKPSQLAFWGKSAICGRKSRSFRHYYMESGFLLTCEERMTAKTKDLGNLRWTVAWSCLIVN